MDENASPAAGSVVELLHGSGRPLRVGALMSFGGRNLGYLLDLSRERPDLLDVVLVSSENPRSPALDRARSAGVPVLAGDFAARCGRWSDCRTEEERRRYRRRAADYHDDLADRFAEFEQREGRIDLVVLAYARWIHGRFLSQYRGRIINQHPGDLAETDPAGGRVLAGTDPIHLAVSQGRTRTRTSTFLVDDSHDGGAILCQGPWLTWRFGPDPTAQACREHERLQAEVSDRAALGWTVAALADRRLAVDESAKHVDGSAVVLLDGTPLPLGGMQLDDRGNGSAPDAGIAAR